MNSLIISVVNLKDWLHHIEDQEKNSEEGVTYEETLSSDEDDGNSTPKPWATRKH